jgi:hypothetical protein
LTNIPIFLSIQIPSFDRIKCKVSQKVDKRSPKVSGLGGSGQNKTRGRSTAGSLYSQQMNAESESALFLQ